MTSGCASLISSGDSATRTEGGESEWFDAADLVEELPHPKKMNEQSLIHLEDPSEDDSPEAGLSTLGGLMKLEKLGHHNSTHQDDTFAEPLSPTDWEALLTPRGNHFDQDDDAMIRVDIEMTMEEIAQSVYQDHPTLAAAAEEVAIARAAAVTANSRQNPRFVVDFDTPVHVNGPSEISTRLTFPLGTRRPRSLLHQATLTDIARAESAYRVIEEQLLDTAVASAIDVQYLQQLQKLDRQLARLARLRTNYLRPDRIDGDAADNTVRFVNSQLDSSQAMQQSFESEHELVIAQADLSIALGRSDTARIWVDGRLDKSNSPIPKLKALIDAKIKNAPEVNEAVAILQKSRHLYQIEQERREDAEMGPRYQDRLGASDDSIGVRFATNLAVHDTQRGPIAEAAAKVRYDQENIRVVKQRIADSVTRAYREWQTVNHQSQWYQEDDFIEEQEAFLRDPVTESLMTAAQSIEIQQAIIRRQRQELRLQYRLATLSQELGLR